MKFNTPSKKMRWLLSIIAALSFTLVACSSSEEKSSSNEMSSNSSKECASVPFGVEQPQSKKVTTVTKANYALAETQVIFAQYAKRIAKSTCSNGLGKFMFLSKPADPKDKTVVRINFDTLYAFALLDLNSPAKLKLPETNGRYQSVWVVTENAYSPYAISKPGEYNITKKNVGEQYAMLIVRTQVNMHSEDDIAEASALAKKITLQQDNPGTYKVSDSWDMDQILSMRKSYQQLQKKDQIPVAMMFGKRGELTQSRHNVGVAIGWGGLTKDQAIYEQYSSKSSNPQQLILKNVPVEKNGFWSLTVYDSTGYPRGDNFNINSSFAKKQKDGSVIVKLGGDKKAENYLEIYDGWTAILRMYLPTDKYFNKSWKKPSLEPQGGGGNAVSYQD